MTSTVSLIERAIDGHAFPGAVVEVGGRDRVAWTQAFGTLTYAPDSPPVTLDTIYDLASLTKVMATAPQAMRAVAAGGLALERRVGDYLPGWRGGDRAAVTIADLLEHASGLTAYLPFFRDHHGRAEFEHAICTLPLEYPPRTQSIYSDLGFMLLGFILEDAGFPLADVGIGALGFNPPRELRARCAPTELDLWRGRLLQGEVHDENCWALGGVAGHAGLFGTAAAVGGFARETLARIENDPILTRFVTRSTVPGSSRALAWDTMLPTSSCGTRMSARAIGHTGFTGTSLWIDPERERYVVLLTNRVHPARDNTHIQRVRRQVHDSIADSWP
jgi:CubicO group peptidase (beta-lactamase class C family)